MTTRRRMLLRFLAIPLLAVAITAAVPVTEVLADHHRYEDRRGGYNDEYIFVATRSALDMEVHPVAKVPLIPATLILDLVALPFEIIAGFF